MKIFISADIEGCAGVAMRDETHKAEPVYRQFADEMTDEVLEACEALHHEGADEITVKDGHGDASNIDPLCMPDYVTLIRGKSGHPYNMMSGLDSSFDGVVYIGYHAAAGDSGSPLSHTSTGNSLYIRLNGAPMSEFLLNSYTAASLGVPVLFLSGDEAICRQSQKMVPSLSVCYTKRGMGASVSCVSRNRILTGIREGVKAAVHGHLSDGLIPMPEKFVYEVTFKDWKRAYQMSFYPGMHQVDDFTDKLVSSQWIDIVTAHSFVVY
jgi:D-amino peptidase